MGISILPDTYWSRLSLFIAQAMGLHFPRERWSDLQRGLEGAAPEFGFEDVAKCVDWLLSSPLSKAQLEILASHLTIGETYFFRDKQTLGALTQHILPELIGAKRGGEQRLRIWSAACCSGEEPYSLAILLHQLLPDLADWHVTILGTDINPRVLRKAEAGIYGEWSFRDVPIELKERYFTRSTDGRFAIIPEIRKLVSFSHLNLVDDVYPSPATNTNAMDLVFCRNVLMYFTPPQIDKVIGKLHHALLHGGWLAVSPSEATHALFSKFTTVNFPGAMLFQKHDARSQTEPGRKPAPLDEITESAAFILTHASAPAPVLSSEALTPPVLPMQLSPVHALQELAPSKTLSSSNSIAETLYQQGLYAEVADLLIDSISRCAADSQAFSLLARALANQGKLADALIWCERWVSADKVNPGGHYLRAIVLVELGDADQARSSFQRALFLRPDFALAHFALGNLARGRGNNTEATRNFANALSALQRHQPSDLLPESDGLSAGRLTEIIISMTEQEPVP